MDVAVDFAAADAEDLIVMAVAVSVAAAEEEEEADLVATVLPVVKSKYAIPYSCREFRLAQTSSTLPMCSVRRAKL